MNWPGDLYTSLTYDIHFDSLVLQYLTIEPVVGSEFGSIGRGKK